MRRKFRPSALAIQNLTLVLVVMTGLVNGLDLALHRGVPIFTLPMLLGPDWWGVFLFPFRVADGWISLAILLYMLWIFGTQLEAEIGDLRYNLYILSGFVSVLLGTFFFPLTAVHVHLSIFLAIAHLAPDMEILLFFILPIRLRWAAVAAVAFALWPSLQLVFTSGSILPLFGPLIGLGNYVFFFLLPTLIQKNRPRPASVRRFQRAVTSKPTIHKCAVCGITEKDDPAMDFRYCIDCQDQEYCSRHLNDHVHTEKNTSAPTDS